MTTRRFAVLVALLSAVALGLEVQAQQKGLADEGGTVGLGLALRHLGNVGIFLETGAHPDDENNGLLVMLNRSQGFRTVLATTTRGAGGQNEIGPELGESLAVLRTEELAAVHRYDGAEQYFARAIDFGYSFGLDETFQKWGRDEILSDYVRFIRMFRPDVILGMRPEGDGGGQHHQASAIITGDAFRAAADPSRFPEQLQDGLRVWQPRKLYYMEGFGGRGEAPRPSGPGLLAVSSDVYDALLGRTCAEIGSEARSNHKCQGMGQLLALPGPAQTRYRLAGTTIPGQAEKTETSLFDGVDYSISGLAQYVRGEAPEPLKAGLLAIAREVEAAQALLDGKGTAAAAQPILAGLTAVRALRAQLGSIGLDDSARYEIDFRLQTKEQEFQQAAVLAQGLRIEALADDGLVVGGQALKTTIIVANRGPAEVQVKQVVLAGVEGESGCKPGAIRSGDVYRCESSVRVPVDDGHPGSPGRLTTPYWRPLPDAERYAVEQDVPFGAPFRPTPFRARLELGLAGVDISVDRPFEYRYGGNIFSGEKRMELKVVPRFSVRIAPGTAIIPAAAVGKAGAPTGGSGAGSAAARELRVTVTNGTKGPAGAEVTLDLPAGWRAAPPAASIALTREDESETERFVVSPPPGVAPGQYRVRAIVRVGADAFSEGYEVIEYPHIQRQHRVLPAETSLKVIDVNVAPKLRVGYVMGVGDQVPPAIEQLGAQLTLLDADALAWGDLSTYDAIVTGVRAYERRADLKANNNRLLEYVRNGGTLVVQYNKFEFNEAQYGPYPAKVSSDRVTDENASVQVLVPQDSIFSYPNRIGPATWKGWVQERGLYFLGEKDPHYVDLVQLEDPFPSNKGAKRGALVETQFGKGRWIYVGLGLWRQVTAGTDGAYQLLANLVSAGRAEVVAAPAPKKQP